MSLRTWRELRDDIANNFESALDLIAGLDPLTFSDKREAAEKARDAALKALYLSDAIEPPKGIDPS